MPRKVDSTKNVEMTLARLKRNARRMQRLPEFMRAHVDDVQTLSEEEYQSVLAEVARAIDNFDVLLPALRAAGRREPLASR